MTAEDARRVVLVRAFETPIAPPWSEADAAEASAQAARTEGEQAGAERLIARRAAWATERLVARDHAIGATLVATDGHPGITWALVALAFAGGLALDAIGPAQRLNIVALPLLGVLCWNLAVYAWLAVDALRGSGSGSAAGSWFRRGLAALQRRATRHTTPALARFAGDWAVAGQPLHVGRIAFVLHAAAAALAAGLLASLYLRGLAFEYRAGWDSTFLTAEGVHRLLSFVLAPALALSGSTLPTPEQLAGLRFSIGPGENAARWIHWLALTVGLVVLLPRGLLAAAAAWRVRRWQRQLPLDLSGPYFGRFVREQRAEPATVHVLPYSYRLAPELLAGLRATLARGFGTGLELQLAEPLPVGSEDDLTRWLPEPSTHATLLPLFALTATPERETHAALLNALAPHRHGGWRHLVLVDESGFRRRFDAQRLAQRRAAWQALLAECGQTPLFVDLAEPDLHALDATLQARARETSLPA